MAGERHTPGPWLYGSRVIEGPDSAVVLATEWDMTVADARLIAAAPDMLAALRGAMVIIETCGWPDDAGDGLRAEFDRRREAIRAAIAKATAAEPTP